MLACEKAVALAYFFLFFAGIHPFHPCSSTRSLCIKSKLKCCYTGSMLDERSFRCHADSALDSLRKALVLAESDADFEVEEQNGALHITFDGPPSKFVLTPNAPVRQIWISAFSASFQLDWNDVTQNFVLPKTGESLNALVARLINEHLGGGDFVLA